MSDSGEQPAGFLIQTRVVSGGPQMQGDRADDVIKGTREKLDKAAAVAREAGEALRGVFVDLAPDSGSVEFTLSFEGEAGIPMLAKGKAGGSITVALEWKGAPDA